MIELVDLTKRFADKTAVNNLNFTIDDGSLTMFIGPSGCGKTTTLKMINRLVEPTEGDIRINGQSVFDFDPVQLRRSIGYVIQEIGLFPHFTVYDNIAVVPRLLKWDEKRIRDRVMELLNLVTLDSSYAGKYPLQLSGGEKQRVGLARALAADPDILLMDEPFGAIDPINRLKLQDSFLEIQEEIKKTIVFVTHDINEAIKLGDKIAIIKDGNLVQYDSVSEILSKPANEFVENLLGQDRNLKALALRKAKDFVKPDGFLIVSGQENETVIQRRLQEKKARYAFHLVDGKLVGRFSLEISPRSGKPVLHYTDSVTAVDRNNSLTETLSRMLEAGAKQLPVVNKRHELVGIINLADIFEQVQEVDGDIRVREESA